MNNLKKNIYLYEWCYATVGSPAMYWFRRRVNRECTWQACIKLLPRNFCFNADYWISMKCELILTRRNVVNSTIIYNFHSDKNNRWYFPYSFLGRKGNKKYQLYKDIIEILITSRKKIPYKIPVSKMPENNRYNKFRTPILSQNKIRAFIA
jgi:hypothetical protein